MNHAEKLPPKPEPPRTSRTAIFGLGLLPAARMCFDVLGLLATFAGPVF